MKKKILILFFIILAHSHVFAAENVNQANQNSLSEYKAQREIDYYIANPISYSGENGEIERLVSGISNSEYGKGNDDEQVYFYYNKDTKEHKSFTVEEFAKLHEEGQASKWNKVLSGSVGSNQ